MQAQYLAQLQTLNDCRQRIQENLMLMQRDQSGHQRTNAYTDLTADEKKHKDAALAIAVKLTRHKNANAQFFIGESYGYEIGLPENEKKGLSGEKALYWLIKAAEQGNPEHQCKFGQWLYYRNEDKENAFLWMTKAAEQGYVDAQWKLGEFYADTKDLKNSRQADYWLNKALEQWIIYNVDLLDFGYIDYTYADSDSIVYDPEKARYWVIKIAEKSTNQDEWIIGQYYAGDERNPVFSTGCCNYGFPKDKEKAAYWFAKATKTDESYQYNLGNRHADGYGVSQDTEKAIYWLTKATDSIFSFTSENAMLTLGMRYADGQGIPKSADKAVYWLDKVAESGDNIYDYCHYGDNLCDYSHVWWLSDIIKLHGLVPEKKPLYLSYSWLVGERYADGKGVPQNSEKAIYYLIKAAESKYGNHRSLFRWTLGERYADGRGIPQNTEQAVFWLTKAAEQGDEWFGGDDSDYQQRNYQWKLGQRYADGKGIPQNSDKASYWLTKAAKSDNADYQWELGQRYADGKGIPQNTEQAVFWMTKAAEQGNSVYQWKLGECYADGYGQLMRKDSLRAEYWLTEAVKHNYSMWEVDADTPKVMLGLRYSTGNGVPKNDEKAEYWLTLAAESGSPLYMFNLCRYLIASDATPNQKKKGIDWLNKLVEMDYPEAQELLASCYFHGNGVEQNIEQTVYWLKKAAMQDHPSAQRLLGELYAMKQDARNTKYWIEKSAALGDEEALRYTKSIRFKIISGLMKIGIIK